MTYPPCNTSDALACEQCLLHGSSCTAPVVIRPPTPSAPTATPAATPVTVVSTPPSPEHHGGGTSASGWTLDLVLLVAVILAAAAARRVPAVATSRVAPYLAAVELGARRVVRSLQWATRGRLAPRLAIVVIGVLLIASFVPGILRLPVVLAGLVALGYTPRKPAEDDRWYAHTNLLNAFIAAGVLKAPKQGEPALTLHYRGRVEDDGHGTTVCLALPAGRSCSDVRARREALAAALGVPAARLEVDQREEDPANVVRIRLAEPRATGVTASGLATAVRTRWAEPVRIGADGRGQPVTLATCEANALLAGQPGVGKSNVARVVLAHYLLDPAAEVYLLDGKGSAKDYGECRPLCRRFVSGVDDDAVDATLSMLTEVLDVVRHRNADGGEHGGVLLLLEELQDVRAAASKAEREQLDSTLGRIVRMGRAVGVSVLISTQRPSVDDLPSGVRNLISQRLALQLRNGQDAALVLGLTPDLPLPKRRGEALLTTGSGTIAVALDLLDQSAWEAVCTRAAALRPARRAAEAPAAGPAAPAEVETRPEAVEAVVDPLLSAVLSVLDDSNPAGLSAAELLARLPEWVRPTSAAALGKALASYPDAVERGHVGSARVWRRPVGGPSATRRSPVGTDTTDGRSTRSHAQSSPAVAPPSAPSVRRKETPR